MTKDTSAKKAEIYRMVMPDPSVPALRRRLSEVANGEAGAYFGDI